MVVLTLSIGKTFEVATDKVELFEKNSDTPTTKVVGF